MTTENEHRMFSAHKAETAELERKLAQSRASVKMLQDKVREVQAERKDAVASLAKRSEGLAASQNDLTLEKSSCRVLQAKLRTGEAERARLRAEGKNLLRACDDLLDPGKVITHARVAERLAGSMILFRRALEPKP